MILSVLWTLAVIFSLASGLATGQAGLLAAAALEGAQSGVTVTLSMAGALCLWTGLARVLEKSGVTAGLSRLLRPLLKRLFPKSSQDSTALGYISGNMVANLLGLGNAATPMGIAAVKRMKEQAGAAEATNEMCRLIVLNTASIQLIPTTVCALRGAAGAAHAFDILPAVWLTSLLSASAGLAAAALFSRRTAHD